MLKPIGFRQIFFESNLPSNPTLDFNNFPVCCAPKSGLSSGTKRKARKAQARATCHVFEWGTFLKMVRWRTWGRVAQVRHQLEHQMSAVGKWMSPGLPDTWSRGARAIARAPPGGHFCAKCDQYMVFLDGLRLSNRDIRDRRSVGWRTGALGRVTTWRTWSPRLLRCGDILPLSENSIFYTFCILSWPQITNGGIDASHISHGDDHVNGSSTRAHKVAPPATWHVPEGVKNFRWP